MDLKGKKILITGSSRGIGAAIAKALSDEGSEIIITYNSNKKKAEEIYKYCSKKSKAHIIKLDVAKNNSIKKLLSEIKEKQIFPDILINNAGVLVWDLFEKNKPEELDHMLAVNFSAPIKITNLLLPVLIKKKEAAIINIASVAAKHIPVEGIAYSATKAGIVAFTTGLAKELPKNVFVCSVSPGLTSTDMTDHEGVPVEKVSSVVKRILSRQINVKSGSDIDVRDYY